MEPETLNTLMFWGDKDKEADHVGTLRAKIMDSKSDAKSNVL